MHGKFLKYSLNILPILSIVSHHSLLYLPLECFHACTLSSLNLPSYGPEGIGKGKMDRTHTAQALVICADFVLHC